MHQLPRTQLSGRNYLFILWQYRYYVVLHLHVVCLRLITEDPRAEDAHTQYWAISCGKSLAMLQEELFQAAEAEAAALKASWERGQHAGFTDSLLARTVKKAGSIVIRWCLKHRLAAWAVDGSG